MSLSSKVQLLVSGAMSRINNKANEVKTLNNELEYFIEQTRKEIESEERKLERERSELVQNEQNFNAFKKQSIEEIEKLRCQVENESESCRSRAFKEAEELLCQAKRESENCRSRALKEAEELLRQAKRESENCRKRAFEEAEKLRLQAKQKIDSQINDVIEHFEILESYGKDPKIINAYIDACFALDEKLAKYFEKKPRPAIEAATTIRCYKKENRELLQRIKSLEYQMSELWAKDDDTSEKEEFEIVDDDEERIKWFLSSKEYSSLSETERNQRALNNYLRKHHSRSHVGKMYERYIGYLYEMEGYDVKYRGIEKGLKDGGIDLICRKGGEILLVQCKNWKLDSTIYEKHVCQLYGASRFYDRDKIQDEYADSLFADLDWERVTPVFISTTNLDDHALEVAKTLGVVVRNIPFDRSYPIIKCNVNNGDRIYHLPIDQMYDHTKVCNKADGECYVTTVLEAEQRGFRRAHRWRGPNTSK